MAIDFSLEKNRYTYAGRQAHSGWADTIKTLIEPEGKRVADIGCGGGIYSIAWREIGAAHVIGVDFSARMIATAREKASGLDGISFQQGDAAATGLPTHSVDVVFQRALIHHLNDYDACFSEAHRILVPGGMLLIQDRTPEDVGIPGSPEHIRGYFFERFPQLLNIETGRRPANAAVEDALCAAGFEHVAARTRWEIRKTYDNYGQLALDLAARTGRSILHELDDAQVQELIAYIGKKMPSQGSIAEQDRWTLWSAIKPG